MAGALEAVAAHGYPATTVALIIKAAGVSRNTFYEYFANKQECVLASYDLIVDWLGQRIAAAAMQPTWPEAVRAAVATTLATVAADPRLAVLCAVEIRRIDRVGSARYQETVGRLAVALRGGRALARWEEDMPPFMEETILGGAIWLIGRRLRGEDPGRLTELAPDITYFLLVPYLDIPAAQAVVAGIR